jgi:hypothetical protein
MSMSLRFSRRTLFSATFFAGLIIHQQPSFSSTNDRVFDGLVANYTYTISQQREEVRRSQECIKSGRGFGCPLGPSASTSAMSMSYFVQIQNYLQAVAQKTYQNPNFCPAASQYFADAYRMPSLKNDISQTGVVSGSGLEMFCLQYGYRLRFR